MKIKGLLFDKDGTLFDFNATWGAFSAGMIAEMSAGDEALAARLSAVLGYDRQSRNFRPGSVVIASPMDEIARAVQPLLGAIDLPEILARMSVLSANAPQVEAAPLGPLLAELAQTHVLGLATNDSEAPARAHLEAAGITGHFAFIAGFDSGWGGKPAPGQLLAFCSQTGLAPGEVAMIGDSLHDMHAARAAGMPAVAVLTGPADAATLAPHAEVVLPDISHLPGWLAARE